MASTDKLRTPKRCYGIACVAPPCIEGHLQPQNGVGLIGRGTSFKRIKTKSVIAVGNNTKNPLQYSPDYEYLKGDMKGLISRRINKQHRLVYEIFEVDKFIKFYRM